MAALETKTFAMLCFNHNTRFDFESLVAEFQQALDAGVSVPTRMRRVGGQFASFDIGPARISLAYSNESFDPDSHRRQTASLAVYVGATDGTGDRMLQDDRAGICKGVLDRVEAVHPCDHRVWGETDRDITPLYPDTPQPSELPATHSAPVAPRRVSKQTAAIRRSRPDDVESGEAYGETQIMPPARITAPICPTHPALHADRIKGRMERIGSDDPIALARSVPRQVVIAARQTAARDEVILRNAMLPDLDNGDDTKGTDRPVAHRMAIYTLNTSLLVICLPVGAAMFSYCALGRENLNVVGRVMALTGIALGLAQNSGLGALLPLIG